MINKMVTDEYGGCRTYTTGDKRVLITGGSQTFGVGQSCNRTTVASLIGQMLGMESVNLSGKAYRTYQEFLSVREYLFCNKTDLIIAISGRNDARAAEVEPDYPFLPKMECDKLRVVGRIEREQPVLANLDGYLRRYSSAVDILARVMRRRRKKAPHENIDPAHDMGRFVDSTLTNYALMRELADRNDSTFVLVLQPINEPDRWMTDYINALRPHADIDLTYLIPEENWIDPYHVNDAGARLIAEAIYKFLNGMLYE